MPLERMAEPQQVTKGGSALARFPCGHLSIGRLDDSVCGLCYDLHESTLAQRIRSKTLRVRLREDQPYYGKTTILRFDCYNRIGEKQHRCNQGFYLSLDDANKCISEDGTPIRTGTILDCKTCHQSNRFPLYKVLSALEVIYKRQFNFAIGPLSCSVGYDPQMRLVVVVGSQECSLSNVRTEIEALAKPGDSAYCYLHLSEDIVNDVWYFEDTDEPLTFESRHKYAARFPRLVNYIMDYTNMPPIPDEQSLVAITRAHQSIEQDTILHPYCERAYLDSMYSGPTITSLHMKNIDEITGGPGMTEILARTNGTAKRKDKWPIMHGTNPKLQWYPSKNK